MSLLGIKPLRKVLITKVIPRETNSPLVNHAFANYVTHASYRACAVQTEGQNGLIPSIHSIPSIHAIRYFKKIESVVGKNLHQRSTAEI